MEVKLADKPGFVDFITKVDSHSSRRTITCTLKLSTRWQRGPRLIKQVKMPAYLILLQMEVAAFHPFRRKLAKNLLVGLTDSSLWPYSSPYIFQLAPKKFQRTAVSRHLALCSPDFPPPAYASGDCLASFDAILTCYDRYYFCNFHDKFCPALSGTKTSPSI